MCSLVGVGDALGEQWRGRRGRSGRRRRGGRGSECGCGRRGRGASSPERGGECRGAGSVARPGRQVQRPGGEHAELRSPGARPAASRARSGSRMRGPSFCEPSDAICASRCSIRALREPVAQGGERRIHGRRRRTAARCAAPPRAARARLAHAGSADRLGDGRVAAEQPAVGEQRVPRVEQPELAALVRARCRRRSARRAASQAGRPAGKSPASTHSLKGSVTTGARVVPAGQRARRSSRSASVVAGVIRSTIVETNETSALDPGRRGRRSASASASTASRSDLARCRAGCRS